LVKKSVIEKQKTGDYHYSKIVNSNRNNIVKSSSKNSDVLLLGQKYKAPIFNAL